MRASERGSLPPQKKTTAQTALGIFFGFQMDADASEGGDEFAELPFEADGEGMGLFDGEAGGHAAVEADAETLFGGGVGGKAVGGAQQGFPIDGLLDLFPSGLGLGS